VNVDFYSDGSKPSLWKALRDIVLFWAAQGVRTFRVDNPHTKPLPFWEWLIVEVRGRYPGTIFLAEAFTRPKLMYRLAKIGFSQSYTYFTWRNSAAELRDYIEELVNEPARDFFRPNFFVNTPDINPFFLQNSGRAGFLIRAALAATLSGLWGIYNGFEVCEADSIPDREEYRDSEKYQLRRWDLDRPGNIIQEITTLNQVRRRNPALQDHRGVRFLNVDDPDLLFYRKSNADGTNIVFVVVSMVVDRTIETEIDLPLCELGLRDDDTLHAEDLMRGVAFSWHGRRQYVRLDPAELPFCIWRVRK
jgi:starch synthase (maltosyl-transferring)